MDSIEALNQAWFLMINATADSPVWLIDMAIALANLLILIVPLCMLGMWLWGDERRRSLALRAVIVVLIGLGLNQLIGLIWQHPRPAQMGIGHVFMQHSAETSFPSDHLTVMAAASLTWFLGEYRRLGVLVFIAGLLVGWARIFVGVHYPLDMLGALLVSVFAYAMSAPLWALTGKQVTRLAVDVYRKLFGRGIAAGWFHH